MGNHNTRALVHNAPVLKTMPGGGGVLGNHNCALQAYDIININAWWDHICSINIPG